MAHAIYLPPEWGPQVGIMLVWPHDDTCWENQLAAVERVYIDVIKAVSVLENVLIICRNQDHSTYVADLLISEGIYLETLFLEIADSNDIWVRDYGLITVFRDHTPILLDFRFNGWGNRYPSQKDNAINTTLHAKGTFNTNPMEHVDMVLEGGSVDSDGAGSLLTTRSCLLNPNRNPRLTRDDIETLMYAILGVDRLLWLEHGFLAGDDTDGHIDNLARFANRDTIVYSICSHRKDEHFSQLKAMERELARLRTVTGKPYELVPLPLPNPIFNSRGRRLPASYVNFLILNGAVLVPMYNDPADRVALTTLMPVFPCHQIIGVDCTPLIQHYGSLHCMTMQFPTGITFRSRFKNSQVSTRPDINR